ncbi:phage tail tape measure protein [Aureivirga marina]|uniref:phage tail tape measure protein n=1 Tax=Aureivirga marina TaxID=1182451 RepID=UPI0018CB580F|nr:phage tail tape measure protein [Aureivirga marina]
MAKRIKDEELRFEVVVNANAGQKKLGELSKANRDLAEKNKILRLEKKKLSDAGKKESEVYKKLSQELRINNKAIKSNKVEIVKLENELGLAALTTGQLAAKHRRLKKDLAGAIPNSAEWKKYEKQLAAVNGQLDLTRNKSKRAGKTIESLNSKLDDFKETIKGAFAIGTIVAFSTEVFNQVKELDKLKKTLKQISNLEGAALDKAAIKIKSMSAVYQEETKEMLIAAQNFSKGTGIEMTEALELMQEGFESGANANEEFLDKLKEYPTLLDESGLKADQMITLMTQEIKEGIYSDKGIDSIKEASIRLRGMPKATAEALNAIGISSKTVQKSLQDGSKTTFEIMQQVSKKLSTLPPQSKVVADAVANIFGSAGEDSAIKYISNLHKFNLAAKETTKVVDKATRAKRLEVEANEKLNAVFNQLTGNTSKLMIAYNTMKRDLADLVLNEKSLSDELRIQQIELNKLFGKLTSTNLKENEKLSIIKELNQKYPDLVKNIDLENASSEELEKVLDKINDQYIKRIVLQKKSEESQKNAEEQAKVLGALANEQERLFSLLQAAKVDYKLEAKVDFGNLEESAKNIFKEIDKKNIGGFKWTKKEIQGALQNLKSFKDVSKQSKEEGKKINEEYKRLKKNLGIITEEERENKKKRVKLEKRANELNLQDFKKLSDEKLKLLIDRTEKEIAYKKAKEMEAAAKRKADLEKAKKEKLKSLEELRKAIIKWEKKVADERKQVKDAIPGLENNIEYKESKNKEEEEAYKEEKRAEEIKSLEDWLIYKNRRLKEIQEEIDSQNKLADEEKELTELETKYAKLEEKAHNDAELLARLEDLKEKEKQAVIDKWQLYREKKGDKDKAVLLKKEVDFKKKLTAGEEALKNARISSLKQGISALKTFVKEGTGEYKALFLAQQLVAAAEVIFNQKKEQAGYYAAYALVPGGPKIASSLSLLSKIRMFASLATIAGQTVKGFENGKYNFTRKDGKVFNAGVQQKTQTGLVTEPTFVADQQYLVGENGPEIVIDTPTLKQLDPNVINEIYATASRVRGFESGKYDSQIIQNISPERDTQNLEMMEKVFELFEKVSTQLESPIRATAIFDNQTAEDISTLQKENNQIRENAKIR